MRLSTIIIFATLIAMSRTQEESVLKRRRLNRFIRGHEDNDICWDRDGSDGYFTIVDSHNHFRPFNGPTVPFDTYIDWMRDHGILFSTMFGIGQLITKSRQSDPECCYYLHCPTRDYKVVPNPKNDLENARDYTNFLANKSQSNSIHLTLSATFINLQNPENNARDLTFVTETYPGAFNWAGEINVFKHALAGNGFFDFPRVTVERIEKGDYDTLFQKLDEYNWTVTLHCDLGCDNYDSIPKTLHTEKGCVVPMSEERVAKKEFQWWKDILGPHYSAFFDSNNAPNKKNFKKIQHLHVWSSLLGRFPNVKVVWAHMGMSKELSQLHPLVHKHIVVELFKRHNNLFADVSWDVLPLRLLMNFKEDDPVSRLLHTSHIDFGHDAAHLFNHTAIAELRQEMHDEVWMENKEDIYATGSAGKIGGPSYAMAMYLDMFNTYSDRFVTGTDFVASMGRPEDYPGLKQFKNPPTGCMKDKANHARQLTDTSSINMFLNDQAFKRIVLGENFFKLIGKEKEFKPPLLCSEVSSELDQGVLIGIVVAVVLLLVAILILIGFLMYTRTLKKEEPTPIST